MSASKLIGVIPARGGSKRVERKNIRLLCGKPLIAYTIEAARQSTLLDDFLVSTEDAEIAEIARSAGAPVPFMRPAELAEDHVSDRDVLKHVCQGLQQYQPPMPAGIVLLRPTTPFKTGEIIDRAIRLFLESGADSVRSVTRAEGSRHPYWMFKTDAQGRALPVVEGVTLEQYYQRQLLPPVYSLNGVVDVIRPECILNGKTLYGSDMRLLEVDEEFALDIDTEIDFQMAELVMKSRGLQA